MKKLSTLIAIVLFALNSYCQTNTFPANGNVGIGTTSPVYKSVISNDGAAGLEIDPAGLQFPDGVGMHTYNRTTNTYVPFQIYSSKLILNGGNVGIGTNKPVARLEVNGDISLARTHKIKFLEVVGGGDRAYIRSTNGTNGEDYNSLIFAVNAGNESMIIKSDGNVGIGTTTTGTHKLAVNGTIGAREIKIEATGWSDFVFENDYQLKNLEEVESYITKNNHLPDVPSEKEVLKNGIQLGEMNAKLLQKIEELTLYMIEQNKEIKELRKEIQVLKTR
ncbi:hypothetical protein [Labilibaculum euxinus]